ncbi:DMT family transporter [Enhydrobacter sp.]|jgi:drug/metabolite transporter (DMT)-like permease|uniref:aromatic amino acid exporter YddG n=1 Tax=Enhydrobacter sp. TaxID=1894999 RepID=UPI002628AF23|nr:DMT family transporter [Enhydrobacter sp.]WIM11011.1 MAG: Permease of the drug/metabolite transporter (DMT) superfamily [Enhydrobacter sp.]
MIIVARERRRAMAAGLGAIVLWGALATLSVLAGPVPPFQMVAMTFAIGAVIGIARARRRGIARHALLRWPARVWLLGVVGLFGYHALYFAALQLAPPAEANLVNYLWPLLIVLLSAPLAGERLGWPHLAGAVLGFAGVALLAVGRGASFADAHLAGYLLALGCAFTWSLYSVLSRRFGETPTDAIAAFCAAASLLSLICHLLFEFTVWPATPGAWLAVVALGLGPAGAAFYLWDHAVKRGDIRALGALSYAAPILSTALLIACGLARPTSTLVLAALLVTCGAVLASRDMWKR